MSTNKMVNKEGNPIHESWANAPDIVLAILRGEHDDDLARMSRAIKVRTSMRYTPLRLYTIDSPGHELHGQTAVIKKVNAKTISAIVGTPEPKWISQEEFDTLSTDEKIAYFTSVYWMPSWNLNPRVLRATDDTAYALPQRNWTPPVDNTKASTRVFSLDGKTS